MVFGEIVEPSTRAFYEDDYFELENHIPLEWVDDVDVPKQIDALLISETDFANKIIETALLVNEQPIAGLKHNEAKIYKVKGTHKYVILCNLHYNTSIGELTERLQAWIDQAKIIYAITTESASLHQNKSSQEDVCLRMLGGLQVAGVQRLEVPNLLTGIGANVLSYLIHRGKLEQAGLFVGYVHPEPINSLNSQPFIRLLTQIDFKPNNLCKLHDMLPSNNIYM